MRVAAIVAALVLLAPLAARAQDDTPGATFVTGVLRWNPKLQLQDFGYDSNVFSTPVAPVWDLMARLVPSTDAAVDLTHIKLSGLANANLQYFERYANQRSIGGAANIRAEFPLERFVPALTASYDSVRDIQAFEIDTRQRHQDKGVSAGLSVYLGTRLVASLVGRQDTTAYAGGEVSHGVDLSSALNRRSQSATATLRFGLTPLTSLVANGSYAKDSYIKDDTKDQRTLRGDIGLEFTPDAVINGRVAFGYHDLTVVDPQALPYKGYTASVNLSYLLLSVTRFSGQFSHDTSTSIEAPYYVQTTYGLDVEQQFVGPLSLLARFNRQLADYLAIPERHVDGRTDRLDTYGAGVNIRMSGMTTMTINYELTKRYSNLPDLGYDRQRLTTSVTMGF